MDKTNNMETATKKKNDIHITEQEALNDYRTVYLSRQISIIGRKEVLTGKAEFGIFGDGKEVAQVAMAKNFRKGDWRSGYYRDQTFMLAVGLLKTEEMFFQLYGHTDITENPSSGGRSMNNHYCTRTLNDDGSWKSLMQQKNSSSDVSCTAGQMPRLLGLAYASKLFRNNRELLSFKELSNKGNEVAFGTIGDASTAQGHFWETINAAGVLQVPMALAIWDDGYGVSVPTSLQVAKGKISEVLKGFEKTTTDKGILIYKVKGWNYPALMAAFREGIAICREQHIPVVFHVEEMTQPSGHSSSGSHERYKSKERLQFEEDYDPMKKMREWIIENKLASHESLEKLEKEVEDEVKTARDSAWKKYRESIENKKNELITIIESEDLSCDEEKNKKFYKLAADLKNALYPLQYDIISTARKFVRNAIRFDCFPSNQLKEKMVGWLRKNYAMAKDKYSTALYNESKYSALKVKELKPVFSENSPIVNGREIIRDNFDKQFKKNPLLVTFGEDTGKLGDVHKGIEGLQDKHGVLRVTDTGIRETTILGQGIGMALRGLRPIAEIQYLDYLIYAVQTISDDLATTHWRSNAGQAAPVIIRTRGHRLEGIWHSGSPMGMIINALRGLYVCVPRNMTQAAGFYNTLLEGQDPALVIEPLNGYAVKERKPDNMGEYKTPLGKPEIIQEGSDITLVTYGSCVRIAQNAVHQLKELGISVELIDVQTLIPFDLSHTILRSLKKTNKILFVDEDVPGGTTAYMMQKVLQEQSGYYYLDAQPAALSGADHRPGYTLSGDYFSKPSADDMVDEVYKIMSEYHPQKYPELPF